MIDLVRQSHVLAGPGVGRMRNDDHAVLVQGEVQGRVSLRDHGLYMIADCWLIEEKINRVWVGVALIN